VVAPIAAWWRTKKNRSPHLGLNALAVITFARSAGSRPNPSVEARPNGIAPGPRGAVPLSCTARAWRNTVGPASPQTLGFMNTPHPTSADNDLAASEIAAASQHAERLTRLAYAGFVVGGVVVAAYLWRFHGPVSKDPAAWGQFGDYVGGVLNPTFSFLALLALLATFGLQVRELRISARELKNSADALVRQNDTLQKQTFEATFFQLLQLHNDIVNAMAVPARSLTGRACFQYYVDELEKYLTSAAGNSNFIHATADYPRFAVMYDDFYSNYESSLGHYFRLLYNIVKFVDQSSTIDHRFYTNLIRAQLSSAELRLVFFNCLTQWGQDKFKPLVERYALLKTLSGGEIPSPVLFKRYEPSAFGGQFPLTWPEQ